MGNIGGSHRESLKKAVFADGSDWKHAVTHWKVIHRYGYVTLLELRLETGRTHQIRVHLKAHKHPLIADWVYNERTDERRLSLFAESISFTHPDGGEMTLEAPLSEFMQRFTTGS